MGISGSQNGGTVPYKAIFCGDIPLHRPYIGLIYGRYLQFRFLKWPLIFYSIFHVGHHPTIPSHKNQTELGVYPTA